MLTDLLSARNVVLVVAHPDDEAIGAGSRFRHWPQLTIIHVTDGAPADMQDARRNGFDTALEYARARRAELLSALHVGGAAHARTEELNIPDQRASMEMASAARRIASLLADIRPEFVLTHPYEGGHPDHDACAFAVHAAACLIEKPPLLVEFTSYHASPQGFEICQFLHEDPGEILEVILSEEERELKTKMLKCFVTQPGLLRAFPVAVERFRPAPAYDFTQAPHSGQLHYERYPWGMTGSRFRELAGEHLRELGIAEPLL